MEGHGAIFQDTTAYLVTRSLYFIFIILTNVREGEEKKQEARFHQLI